MSWQLSLYKQRCVPKPLFICSLESSTDEHTGTMWQPSPHQNNSFYTSSLKNKPFFIFFCEWSQRGADGCVGESLSRPSPRMPSHLPPRFPERSEITRQEFVPKEFGLWQGGWGRRGEVVIGALPSSAPLPCVYVAPDHTLGSSQVRSRGLDPCIRRIIKSHLAHGMGPYPLR